MAHLDRSTGPRLQAAPQPSGGATSLRPARPHADDQRRRVGSRLRPRRTPFAWGGLGLCAVCLLAACRGESSGAGTAAAGAWTINSGGAGGAAGAPNGGAAGSGANAGAGGSSGGAGGEAALTLMSWNLENFPLSASTTSTVAQVLAAEQADVVAIQEIEDPTAFESFAASLPDYEGLLNDDPGGFLRLGLLYRPARVSVREVETLFVGDWYAFPRPPLSVRVSVTSAGFDLRLVVVHLKAQLDAESQARREAACEALDAWLAEQLDAGVEPDVVVAGDFNDELTDPPDWNVFDALLGSPGSYTFLTLPLEQAGDHTYLPFDSFIDHVLVTNDALDEYGTGRTDVIHLEESYPSYEDDVSDHRPVRVRFAPAAR